MILPCLTLSYIRYVSGVKWSNLGKGVAPSPTPQCSSYWKGSLLVAFDYSHQLYFYLLYSRPEWTWKQWQWKGALHFPKLQHYWELTIKLFRVMSGTFVGRGDLPLCREAVSVFSFSGRWEWSTSSAISSTFTSDIVRPHNRGLYFQSNLLTITACRLLFICSKNTWPILMTIWKNNVLWLKMYSSQWCYCVRLTINVCCIFLACIVVFLPW